MTTFFVFQLDNFCILKVGEKMLKCSACYIWLRKTSVCTYFLVVAKAGKMMNKSKY